MSKIIFTPWRDQSELLDVRSAFYPPEPDNPGLDSRESACQKVAIWKLRGNLPHEVEATALLTSAILHDNAKQNSIFSISATYAAAFCRFVTGLVDSKLHGQRKTMFQRATDLGLPASFVELRHEATHRELPSLVVLRSATHRSLGWLWGFYWSKLDAPLIPSSDFGKPKPSAVVSFMHAVDGTLHSEIRSHLSHIFVASHDETRMTKKKAQRIGLALSQPLSALCRRRKEGTDVLIQVLLEKDIVLPAEKPNETSLQDIFSLWDPLLVSISEEHPPFFNTLTEELLNRLAVPQKSNAGEDKYLESLYMWLNHMLTSPSWKGPRRQLSWAYLAATCNELANRWTNELSEVLKIALKEDQASRVPSRDDLEEKAAMGDISYKKMSPDQISDSSPIAVPGWDFADNRWRPLYAVR